MRIAISCHPTTGGSGIVATELAMALARRGHEVHMVSCGRPIRLDEGSGVRWHEVKILDYPLFRFPPHDLCLANKLAEVTAKHRIEVIHAHYAVPHATCAILARDIAGGGVKVAATLHGTDITLVGNQREFFDLVRHTMNACDGLTAVSEWLKARTIETFRPEVPVRVIPNFVDERRFNAAGRNPLPAGGPIEIVHASNFRPVKRIFDVIRLFDGIRRKVPARLLLLGDGPELGPAREFVAELGLSDIVIFNGPTAHMAEVLRCGHLFVLISEFESFGLSALEAMACGVPVLGTDAGGLKEVVIPGETGFLFPVGAVEEAAARAAALLADGEAWERMSRTAARRSRETFGTDKVVAEYEEFYQGLLAGT